MEYWISDGFKQEGPYPVAELPRHGLRPDSLVWHEGMPEWVRADAVPEINALLVKPDPVRVQPARVEPVAPAQPGTPPPMPRPADLHYHGPPPGGMPQTSSMAIASLICGVLALVFLASFACAAFIPTVLAIIFGHIALGRTRDNREGGRGLAMAGLVLGYIVAGLHVLGIVVLGLILLVAASA
jgi:hypothetical protein